MIYRQRLVKEVICGEFCQKYLTKDEVQDSFCLKMDLMLCKIMYKIGIHNYLMFDTKLVAQLWEESFKNVRSINDYKNEIQKYKEKLSDEDLLEGPLKETLKSMSKIVRKSSIFDKMTNYLSEPDILRME